MNTKDLAMEVKAVNEDGTFSGYASTFGNIDLGGDMMVKGAFTKTLSDRASKIKMLWNHDKGNVIGVFDSIKEDDNGLYVNGQLALKTQQGQEAYELLKMGAIDSMSIGYAVLQDGYDRKNNVRLLKEVKLFEASLVTIPMNEDAMITNVKSNFDELEQTDKEAVLEFIKSLKDHTDDANEDVTADVGVDIQIEETKEDDYEDDIKKLIESMKSN